MLFINVFLFFYHCASDFMNPSILGIIVDVETVEERNVNIYPNPARDFIKLSAVSCQQSVVRVYNCLGMLVDEIEMSSDEIEINVSDYNPGIYFFNIETESGNVTKKFIKN